MTEKIDKVIKYSILVIWASIILLLFGISLIKTVDIVNDMDIFFYDDSFIRNVFYIIIVISIGVVVKIFIQKLPNKFREDADKYKKIFTVLFTIVVFAFLLWWILITQFQVSSDEMLCLQYAQALLDGDSSAWVRGYMETYPFQNGLVLYDALLVKLFAEKAFVAFQVLNVFYFVIASISIYITCKIMFKNYSNRMAYFSLLIYYPFAMYVVLCYGVLLGFALACLAVMFLYRYFEKRKILNLVFTAVFISLSMIIKANYSIFLVAIVLFLLYDAFIKRKVVNLIGLAIIIASVFVSSATLNFSIEKLTGVPVSKGIPKIAWVAMGIQEQGNTPGWFNAYNTYVYQLSGEDYDATVAECKRYMQKRWEVLKAQKGFKRFYYQKITSQWNSPTFECFTFQQNVSETPYTSLVEKVQPENIGGYKYILNILHSMIYFGVFMYILLRGRSCKVTELFFAVLMIGGFIFYTLWEAKTQYVVPYFYLMIPYAVYGWKAIVNIGYNYFDRCLIKVQGKNKK